MRERLERLREAWAGLSGREQRLLSLMLGVGGLLVAGTAVVMTSAAIAEVREERQELRDMLLELDQAQPRIQAALRRRQEADDRYSNPVPPLGSYLEQKAQQEGLELRQVHEQPEKQIGKYRRRHVRVHMNGVELRPLMRMIAALYDHNVPVAIEQLDMQHYTSGDRYNVELGVYAFDKEGPGAGRKGKE